MNWRDVADEPYEPRGIPTSEMAFILVNSSRLGIDVFIESGRARGQSTYFLAKYLPNAAIHSVEARCKTRDEKFARERLGGFMNLRLHCGRGEDMLPRLVKIHAGRRIAILCDGPKGEAAVPLVQECFKSPDVKVAFMHDMRRLDYGQPSIHRAMATAAFPDHKFSDDPDYIALASWMDKSVVEANGPVGPLHEAEYGSYGPTVGAFFNSKQQQASKDIKP